MVEQSGWVDLTEANPNHSDWYIERFRSMAAAGNDLAIFGQHRAVGCIGDAHNVNRPGPFNRLVPDNRRLGGL